MIKKTLLFLFFFYTTHFLISQESADFLDKPYSGAVFLTTHNAFNSKFDGFVRPNQINPVAIQLIDGVRGLMLDVYMLDGIPQLYHGYSQLGHKPLIDVMNDIKTFMDAQPNAIITIQFENYVDNIEIVKVFDQAGLTSYVHTQAQDQEWPTLRQMISNGKRLVIFCENKNGTSVPWIHYVWDYDVETNYDNKSRSDFSFSFNRGDPSNRLFTLNHFIGAIGIGTGIEDSAAAINSYAYLYNRAYQAYVQTGKIPNFIAVDFYDRGEPMRVVDQLNAMRLGIESNNDDHIILLPNPSDGKFYLMMKTETDCDVDLFNCTGQKVYHSTLHSGSGICCINGTSLDNGVYLVRISNKNELHIKKLIINR